MFGTFVMGNFYQTLYSPKSTADLDTFFEKEKQPVAIRPDDLAKMEKESIEQEILNIVESLPNNLTPGEDGLPSEFYKKIWLDIKNLLLNSYKFSFETGQLSITQKRGLLFLTPKNLIPCT